MDIDDDNSSAGTLHNEGQGNAMTSSTASTQHAMAFGSDRSSARMEETTTTATTTTTTITRTISQAIEDTAPFGSNPQSESPPFPTTISYSPTGLATSWAMIEHNESQYHHLPTDVHSMLPDVQGICHYHRPPLLMSSDRRSHEGIHGLPRSLLARNLEFIQRESMARIEANQRAMEQVVRRLAITRRCLIPPEFGRGRYVLNRSPSVVMPSRVEEFEHGSALPPNDSHGDEWVSDSECKLDNDDDGSSVSGSDPLTQDTYDLLLRMQVRSAARRANSGGVSKAVGIRRHRAWRGRHTSQSDSLSTAYSRFKTDESKSRETVSTLGQGNSDEIMAMLRQGVSVNIADAVGRTPLHVASSCGNVEAVRLLIHMGANVNATDRIGNTPLTIAATGARTNVILPLLEGGADPRIGQGLVSAMAMVRSRLRMLRMNIRHARSVEQVAACSITDILPRVRERRRQAVAVAKECVEIINLLREYTQRHADAESNPNDALRDIYQPKSEPELPGLSNRAVSELDSLSEQLLSLEIARPTTAHQDEKGKLPDLHSNADSSIPGDDQARQTSDSSESSSAQDEDRQIEDLLEKFSLLLGDDGNKSAQGQDDAEGSSRGN
ncbi:hypothetical protein GGF42_002356 [Coemansia sp. RSA 2424]|nr:hypothetical protein GGF42_002356 [Coemansia sp. RSA 2424]